MNKKELREIHKKNGRLMIDWISRHEEEWEKCDDEALEHDLREHPEELLKFNVPDIYREDPSKPLTVDEFLDYEKIFLIGGPCSGSCYYDFECFEDEYYEG